MKDGSSVEENAVTEDEQNQKSNGHVYPVFFNQEAD